MPDTVIVSREQWQYCAIGPADRPRGFIFASVSVARTLQRRDGPLVIFYRYHSSRKMLFRKLATAASVKRNCRGIEIIVNTHTAATGLQIVHSNNVITTHDNTNAFVNRKTRTIGTIHIYIYICTYNDFGSPLREWCCTNAYLLRRRRVARYQ